MCWIEPLEMCASESWILKLASGKLYWHREGMRAVHQHSGKISRERIYQTGYDHYEIVVKKSCRISCAWDKSSLQEKNPQLFGWTNGKKLHKPLWCGRGLVCTSRKFDSDEKKKVGEMSSLVLFRIIDRDNCNCEYGLRVNYKGRSFKGTLSRDWD
jgi:hypothetical protein